MSWCRQYLARELGGPVDAVAVDVPLIALGIDSVRAAALLVEAEERYEVAVPVEDLDERDLDIALLAAVLSGRGHILGSPAEDGDR